MEQSLGVAGMEWAPGIFSSLCEEQTGDRREAKQQWGENGWWMSVLEQGCAGSVKLRTGLKGADKVGNKTKVWSSGSKTGIDSGLIMRWGLGVVNDTQSGKKPRVARLIGWKAVFSHLEQGGEQEYPDVRRCKFWGMVGTVVCFMFHVPLCTPEGESKAPEVSHGGKMFYPCPVLIQGKADGLLHVNCIDPVRGDVCGASSPPHFPVGVNVSPDGRFSRISFPPALSKVVFRERLTS